MKVMEVKKFLITDHQRTTTIEFFPIDNMPGFSHKVAVNGAWPNPRSWLSADFKPNQKAARFFYNKHVRQQA
jgi:hypothetical protein